MADLKYISKLNVGGVEYNLKDAEARTLIQSLEQSVSGIHQFNYQVVDELPTAAEGTMYTIYLVSDNGDGNNVYAEYITLKNGNVYKWEKLGDIALDLNDYLTNVSTTDGDAVTGVNDHTYTPSGSVSLTKTTKDIIATVSGRGIVKVTAAGTISDQTVSVTPNTESIAHVSVTSAGTLPSKAADEFSAGTLPSKAADEFSTGTLPSFSGGVVSQAAASKSAFATQGIVASVNEETLTFSAAGTSNAVTECGAVTQTDINFNAGTLPSFKEGKFSKGTLPSFKEGAFDAGALAEFNTTNKTIVTGIKDASVTKAEFMGTEVSTNVNINGSASGSIETADSASFSGSEATIGHDADTAKFIKTVTPVRN